MPRARASCLLRVFKAKQLGTCHKNITDSLPWYKIKYTIFILYIIKNKELGQRGHLWNFVNYAGSKKKKKDQNAYKTSYPPSILTRINFSWKQCSSWYYQDRHHYVWRLESFSLLFFFTSFLLFASVNVGRINGGPFENLFILYRSIFPRVILFHASPHQCFPRWLVFSVSPYCKS